MPNNFSLSVDGLDRVMTAFNDLSANTSNRVLAKLGASAQRVYDASQATVAVDTGELKDSGQPTLGFLNGDPMQPFAEVTYGNGDSTPKTYSYPGNQVMGSMEADGYAWFVELGTSKMPARPFLGPPFESESQQLVTTLGDILGG